MSSYVFDTDVLSDLLLGEGDVQKLIEELQTDDESLLLLSEITRAEILTYATTDEMESDVATLLNCFNDVIAVDETVSRKAAVLRKESNGPAEECPTCRKRTGGRLKTPDSIVAATAVTEGAVLITRNYRDYARICEKGLLDVMSPTTALKQLLNPSESAESNRSE